MTGLKFLIVALLTFNFSVADASKRVEFSADRIHGLLVFVETISGSPHRSVDLKKAFDESKFNNAKSKEHIETFRSLRFVLGKFLEFEGLPERHMGNSASTMVLAQASFAKDLADLRQRSISILPMPELNKLMNVLKYFEPVYNTLIWKPHLSSLRKIASEFEAKSVQWKVDSLFTSAVKFYGADWPIDQKFRVSLYPIPPGSKHSSAQAYGAVESVGVIIGEKDREGRFGVIFHELAHSLYQAQSIKLQKMISEGFKKSSSKFSMLSYGYLNEALATAIGNGWAYSKAKGKLDPEEWYNDEKIEGFSRSIFPIVSQYLNSSRTIDIAFINSVTDSFSKRFPDSILEFGPALNKQVLITDGVIDSKIAMDELDNFFRVSSVVSRSPINDDETLATVRSLPDTVLAVVTQKQRSQIDSLDDVFKGISEHIELLPQAGNYLAMFDVGVRKVIVLIVDDPALVSKAFKIMGQKKKVEKLNSFVELKFQTP